MRLKRLASGGRFLLFFGLLAMSGYGMVGESIQNVNRQMPFQCLYVAFSGCFANKIH